MALTIENYRKAVLARRSLTISDCIEAKGADMKTLTDVGWDGDYVVPNQLSSCSFDGPVLLLNNWYGWEALTALEASTDADLRKNGYLKNIPTNRWLDRALEILGLGRSDVYITQASVFLPPTPTGTTIPREVYRSSVERVLKLELAGRRPVALGSPAKHACMSCGIDFEPARHPSYQGGERRAQEIAAAIRVTMQ